jgi:hypothetical protein
MAFHIACHSGQVVNALRPLLIDFANYAIEEQRGRLAETG